MAESTKLRRGRGKAPEDLASNGRAEDESEAMDATQDEQSGPESQGDESPSGERGKPTLTSELRDTIREAAIEVLRPVARKATMSAAKYAVTKGPDLMKDKVAPKISDAGGAGALAKGVASKGGGVASTVSGAASGITDKLGGIGGKGKDKKGKAPTGTGRGRRLPVQVYVDVAADLETTYDQFTQFEDWPQFMHRVEKIEQRDDTTLMWHENIWGVRRQWEAEITEQIPCERLTWRSTGGPQTVGVATFHRMSDRLTRVYVNLDFQPQGLFEKTASGMRLSRRALTSDLMRFKAFVEMRDEATGEWRGKIEEGEVVEESEGGGEEGEASEDERDEPQASEEEEFEDEEEPEAEEESADEEEPEAEEDVEEEDEEAEEPEAEADEDYADEDEEEEPEEEPEEQPKKAARKPARARPRRKPATRARG
jgi:uncharacterized membrane protein